MKTRLLVVALVSLCACGSDGNGSTVETLDIAVDPDSYTVRAGENVVVDVQIVRSNELAGTAVYLTVDGTKDGLTATTDASLATADAGRITVSTTVEARQGIYGLNVIANGTTLQRIAQFTVTVLPPAPVDLQGRVTDNRGYGVSDARLDIWSDGASAPQQVTAMPDGSFTATGIVRPYDVRIHDTSLDDVLFLRLYGTTPLLALTSGYPAPTDGATVSGSFTGSSDVYVFAASTERAGGITSPNAPGTYACVLPTSFAVDEPITVSALAFTSSANGMVASYDGFARTTATRVDSITATADITFSAVPSRTLHLAGTAVNNSKARFSLAYRERQHLTSSLGYNDVFADLDTMIPTDPEIDVVVIAQGVDANGRMAVGVRKPTAADTLSFTLGDPAVVVAPAPNATASDATVFEVKAAAGAVNQVRFDRAGHRSVSVVTEAASFTLATMRARGITLESGATYGWTVTQIVGQGGADEGVSTERLVDDMVVIFENARGVTVN